ncbi:MAG: hypothetical protein V4617_14395 [Gemmatimonadota bacterium]
MLVAATVLAGCSTFRGRADAPATTNTARIPRDAARFEIESVDDSTARFRAFEATWVRKGMMVYAVDPAKRDALVARLRITGADSGGLVALVTAQVTRVTTDHFLLAVKPKVPWYRTRTFWLGMLGGGVAGTTGAVIAR